ncbi:MAG TPA: diaminopimelate decarboxylase [Kofleriaceae bacterium]|nr:diaminopimelate decarboxylase [Kofleriaceae bacterium]
MNHFHYREGELCCEDVPLARIAAEVGTPVYVYSTATIERHYRVFDEALAGLDHLICFSVKACSNLSVLRLLFRLGAGADIVSGGELARVTRAGGRGDRVVFSGVGKTEDEMRQALAAGVLAFNVESEPELRVLDQVAAAAGSRARVSLRVNPDVDAQTHPYISTGLKNNKFGIPWGDALETYRLARSLQHLEVVGVDCHIGSQLTRTSPFADAMARLVDLVQKLDRDGFAIRMLDIGGGLGIPYGKEEEPEPPTPGEYGEAVKRALAPLSDMKLKVLCEPGRVIVGNAGVFLTRVIYDKPGEAKRFLIVDGAMNDLMRPALYGSFHPMRPVVEHGDRLRATMDVVGPICETGDFLARDRELPLMERGELLAVGAAGAYGFTMSSNYNTRPRAAEVLVSGATYQVVRRRETVEQLLANED